MSSTSVSSTASDSAADLSPRGLHPEHSLDVKQGGLQRVPSAYSSGSSLLSDILQPHVCGPAGASNKAENQPWQRGDGNITCDGLHLKESWQHIAQWATEDSAQAAVSSEWSAEQSLVLELQLQSAEANLVSTCSSFPSAVNSGLAKQQNKGKAPGFWTSSNMWHNTYRPGVSIDRGQRKS